MGSVESEPISADEGFRWATRSALALLLCALLLPALLTFFNLFSAESQFSSISESFLKLFVKSFLWGTLMATLSSLLSIALAIPPALFIGFSALKKHRWALKILRVAGILIFTLPSGAIALGLLAALPESAPAMLQRGMVPVVLAHLFWNHLLLVDVFQNKLQNWLEDSGARQVESARSLGASTTQILRSILLPALSPEISFFASTIFLWSLTAFGTVLILGGGPGASSLETLSYYHLFGSFDPARLAFLLPTTFVVNFLFFKGFARFLKKSPSLGASFRSRSAFEAAVGGNPFFLFAGGLLVSALALGLGAVLVVECFHGASTLLFSGDPSAQIAAALRSLFLALASALSMGILASLSVFADARPHPVALLCVGISPALLSVAWSQAFGNFLHRIPFCAQVGMTGFMIALSLWPLADYWIARRKSQITPQVLEAAASLGVPLKLRLFKIRYPFLRDVLLGSCLFAGLAGFSDLLFSSLFLDNWKTLALLAQEKAARYEFATSHFFLLSAWTLAALLLFVRNPFAKRKGLAC